MTRELKPWELNAAHHICLARANASPAHKWGSFGCPACQAAVVALVDGPAEGGLWPKGPHRAFVEGAKWWQFKENGATAFPSEVDEMEAEAVRRYGDPAEGGQTDTRDAVELDKHGTLRWRKNPLVDALYEHSKKHGVGLNELVDMQVGDARDWRELAKLIGYSLRGYCELSYVCDDDDEITHVEAVADAAMSAVSKEEHNDH